MEIRTLEHCSVLEITEVFNEAFSDYIIPLKLTEQAMADKMKTENLLPELSAGAFDNGRLIGFILHGYDVLDGIKTVYNGGTGVVPSYRGQAITEKIYNFIIPKLESQGIHRHILEVISTNKPAIRVYERMGFNTQRELGVFKKTTPAPVQNDMRINDIEPNQYLITAFRTCEPSWQNNTPSILRNREGHQFIGAFSGVELVGYAVYVRATGRVKQLAVHPEHRRKGTGTALISYMMQNKQSDALVFTNVDLSYFPGVQFFEHLGFEKTLTQFEMILAK